MIQDYSCHSTSPLGCLRD